METRANRLMHPKYDVKRNTNGSIVYQILAAANQLQTSNYATSLSIPLTYIQFNAAYTRLPWAWGGIDGQAIAYVSSYAPTVKVKTLVDGYLLTRGGFSASFGTLNQSTAYSVSSQQIKVSQVVGAYNQFTSGHNGWRTNNYGPITLLEVQVSGKITVVGTSTNLYLTFDAEQLKAPEFTIVKDQPLI